LSNRFEFVPQGYEDHESWRDEPEQFFINHFTTSTQTPDTVLDDSYRSSDASQSAVHEPDDCPFCRGSDSSVALFAISQPLRGSDVVLTPALGMLMPGYLLGVTRHHVSSFAQYDEDQLRKIEERLSHAEQYMSNKAGYDSYFRFEHGSDAVDACRPGAGACISHAHQHLIPDEQVAEAILASLPWERLSDFTDLTSLRGEPYVYFGHKDEHYAVRNPRLPSQWARRKIGEIRAIEHWDWATYNGARELMQTFFDLQCFPRGRTIVNLSGDTIVHESHPTWRLNSLKM
jgi:diadenosine tetraphosphate (Ap4A) HIT family hydrolase